MNTTPNATDAPASKTDGQVLAEVLRQVFKVGTRTRRHRKGADLHIDMIEAIENAVQLPGYFSPEKTDVFRTAWGAVMSYNKHVRGYRIDGTLANHINALSAYQFAALLGRMVDAGVATTGDGERFFADMARALRSASVTPAPQAAEAVVTAEATYYEVVWGKNEEDRIAYVDHHDGSYLSEHADVMAARKFLELQRHGVKAGLYKGGVFQAGTDISGPRPAVLDNPELYARWVAGEVDENGEPFAAPVVEHKTRTVLDAHQNEHYKSKSNGSCGRYVRSDTSVALCTCGWKRHAGTREEARASARWHRREMAEVAG